MIRKNAKFENAHQIGQDRKYKDGLTILSLCYPRGFLWICTSYFACARERKWGKGQRVIVAHHANAAGSEGDSLHPLLSLLLAYTFPTFLALLCHLQLCHWLTCPAVGSLLGKSAFGIVVVAFPKSTGIHFITVFCCRNEQCSPS